MDNKLKIAVIEGTIRPERKSIHAARFVYEIGKAIPEIEVIFVDPTDYSFPFDGRETENTDPRYGKIVAEVDGFFIITPEYNHSIPSSLKRMLDSEKEGYVHKPIAIAGVSSGPWGGVRAIEALLPVARTLGLVLLAVDMHFPNIEQLFTLEGKITDDAYSKRVQKIYAELIWMAKALKTARLDNSNSKE